MCHCTSRGWCRCDEEGSKRGTPFPHLRCSSYPTLFFTPYRLGADEIEIGLGIHGEPGTTKTPSMPADALVQRMLSQIVASKHFGGPLAQVSGKEGMVGGFQIVRCMPIPANHSLRHIGASEGRGKGCRVIREGRRGEGGCREGCGREREELEGPAMNSETLSSPPSLSPYRVSALC